MFSRGSRRLLLGPVALLLILLGSAVQGEIPRKINYQGRLADADTGEPLPGERAMTFRICDAAIGGTEIWSEPAVVAVDSAGVFSAILGETNPLDLTFDGPVWLEVEVGGEVLSPRREIVSVPFAFRAVDCDSLGGVSSASYWTAINDGPGSGLDADRVDGLDAAAFADTSHTHDDRYVQRDSLGTTGVLNDGTNPVDWTRLKGVPESLADGVDDVGGVGDGYSLDAVDGEPVDAVYVDDEGNVGIGTASPQERLHLSGAASRILVSAGTSDPEIGLGGLVDLPSDVWRIYKHRGTGGLRFAQAGIE